MEALRQLLEIATGDGYADKLIAFGEPHVHEGGQAQSLSTIMQDADKEEAVRKALNSTCSGASDGRLAKRMKLGRTAISRRVTATKAATFGYQPRVQAYGRRRWKTHTGALVAAEREKRRDNVGQQ